MLTSCFQKTNGWNVSMAFLDKTLYHRHLVALMTSTMREVLARDFLSSITEQWYYKKALASCTNFSSSYDYGCSSCIEAISDFRDYQLRISNVSANDKKAKIGCGVAVLISVVAENLKNSAWIDDFYRCLPASDAFNEGYMQVKCKYNYSVFSLKEFIHFLEFYMVAWIIL